jgi:hypothetical protein
MSKYTYKIKKFIPDTEGNIMHIEEIQSTLQKDIDTYGIDSLPFYTLSSVFNQLQELLDSGEFIPEEYERQKADFVKLIKSSTNLIERLNSELHTVCGGESNRARIKLLIDYGANLEHRFNGYTYLDNAILGGNTEHAQFLSSLGIKESGKINPIWSSIVTDDLSALRNLLNPHNPNTEFARVCDEPQWTDTPLDVAARYGHTEIVKYLLQQGVNPNVRNKRCSPPLLWAAKFGFVEMAKILLAYGADSNIFNDSLATPFSRAVEFDQAELVELFIANGADIDMMVHAPLSMGVDDMNDERCTVICIAIINENLKIVNMLLNSGASLDEPDDDQNEALTNAIMYYGKDKNYISRAETNDDSWLYAYFLPIEVAEHTRNTEIINAIKSHKANTSDVNEH